MWRQRSICANSDSDQSISDEEDTRHVSPAIRVSLEESSEMKKEIVPLAMQLEILRGAYGQDHERKTDNIALEKEAALSLEDEVEVPEFDLESSYGSCLRNAEVEIINETFITEDQELCALSKDDGTGNRKSWNDRLELLITANTNDVCSSSHGMLSLCKPTDGRQCKTKPKLSFRQLNHPSFTCVNNNRGVESHLLPQTLESLIPRASGSLMSDFIEEAEEVNKEELVTKSVESLPLVKFCDKHSMADLFDKLQSNTNLLDDSTEQDINIACVNAHESDSSSTSSDALDDDKNPKPPFSRVQMQTMTDRFQEALSASLLTDAEDLVLMPKPSIAGVFGMLQRVMQMERGRDADFVKKLQNGDNAIKDPLCIDVRILERRLEAKLNVCRCTSAEYTENVASGDNLGGSVSRSREMIIVFSTRICNSVDLEVGNLIRIYPPWKEVRVNDDRVVILSSRFGQIL